MICCRHAALAIDRAPQQAQAVPAQRRAAGAKLEAAADLEEDPPANAQAHAASFAESLVPAAAKLSDPRGCSTAVLESPSP